MVFGDFLILLSIFALKVCLVSPRADRSCEVRARIDSGWICGARRIGDGGAVYASFRGVPYARQPLGILRFQELRPAIPWNHLLDATEEGPVCSQFDDTFGRLMKPYHGMSEACIYANVHVPIGDLPRTPDYDKDFDYPDAYGGTGQHNNYNSRTDRQSGGVPILVYIPGGGFQSGSGDADLNGPEFLVSERVIVISFNYRINVFGFLSLGTPKIPGNQGLRDMVTLLRWVRRNARAFGGDPDNVTLMGQSAGSSSAHLLSLSKATRGLFRRVILMSGTGNPGFFTTSPIYAKFVATLFLTRLGINATDPDYIHDQLVNIPLERILKANSDVQYITGLISFSPVVESPFTGVTRILDDKPTELIKRGRDREYPFIIGYSSEECEFFKDRLVYLDFLSRIDANPLLILSPELVFRTPPNVSLQLAKRVLRRYFNGKLSLDGLLYSCRDTFFRYPAFKLAEWRASIRGAPVYLYEFSYDSQFSVIKEAMWLKYSGAAHVEDLNQVLRANSILGDRKLKPRDEQMKDWMRMFIVNFMRCSNPTCTSDHESPWPPVDEEVLNYQRIHSPYVYSNRGPTEEQWDMIEFFDDIEERSRRAVAAQGGPTEGTPAADSFINNMTAQLATGRPPYPIKIRTPKFKSYST